MKIVTTSQMRSIEQNAIDNIGIPSLLLMENAALCAVKECLLYDNILILCGKGNNGGDGLAVARGLLARGKNITVIFIGDKNKATKDCQANLHILENLSCNIIYNPSTVEDIIKDYDIVIDALIGTGLCSSLRPPYTSLVNSINAHSKYTLALDCPTGINSDTGAVLGVAVRANKTITFHAIKLGLLLYPAYSYLGELQIGPISIPNNLTVSEYNTLTPSEASNLLPKRLDNSNKGTYGKAFAFCGCDQMPGAAVIVCTSAYKIGCGLVNACVTKNVADVIHTTLPEAVTTILPDSSGYLSRASLTSISDKLDRASCVAIGSGIGLTEDTKAFVYAILSQISCPLVLDADGLNAISYNLEVLHAITSPVIITPHLGEMSRLTGMSISEISADIVCCAQAFSKKYGVITVLKDAHTVIAEPGGEVYINTAGTPAMSKAGSGDGLCGAILGLLAQGVSPFNSAILGAYICGLAGEIAEQKQGSYSTSVFSTIDNFNEVIRRLK